MVQSRSRMRWLVTRPSPPSYSAVYHRPGGDDGTARVSTSPPSTKPSSATARKIAPSCRHTERDLHVRGQRPTPAQVAPEAAQAGVAGGVVVEIGTHEQGATAPEEGVGEGRVGIRARHGDAALAHGIGRAGIGPAKQAQAERRPEPEGRS